jgi:homoserine O-acetyltransferase/O-succinyltransferase
MKRFVISFVLLLLATSLAAAESLTRRSSQEQNDGLKQYYEISDFRLGGR